MTGVQEESFVVVTLTLLLWKGDWSGSHIILGFMKKTLNFWWVFAWCQSCSHSTWLLQQFQSKNGISGQKHICEHGDGEWETINGYENWWMGRRKCCWKWKLLTPHSVTRKEKCNTCERHSRFDSATPAWAQPWNKEKCHPRSRCFKMRAVTHIILYPFEAFNYAASRQGGGGWGWGMKEWQKSALFSNTSLTNVQDCQDNLLRDAFSDFWSDSLVHGSFPRLGTANQYVSNRVYSTSTFQTDGRWKRSHAKEAN